MIFTTRCRRSTTAGANATALVLLADFVCSAFDGVRAEPAGVGVEVRSWRTTKDTKDHEGIRNLVRDFLRGTWCPSWLLTFMESTLANSAVADICPRGFARSVSTSSQALGQRLRTRPFDLASARHHHPVRPVGSREDYAARLHCRPGSSGRRPNRNCASKILFDSALGINLPRSVAKWAMCFRTWRCFRT